jgi:hypothetical protein
MAKDPKTFWGVVLAVASSVPAVSGGIIHGTYNALTDNGTFEEGFNETSSSIWDTASDFGDEHDKTLTNTAISAAGTLLANKAKTDYNNKHKS